jgi:hypothetical protein
MKPIEIKYRNGRMTVRNLHNLSAAMAQQVIQQATPDLREICGDYRWDLDGDTRHGYAIVASDGRGQRWTEGRGKSPRKAIEDFPALTRVLADRFGVEICRVL